MRPQYLLVDGHSIIFAWPELRLLHDRRTSLAREALIKQLRDYQDWSGIKVVVVFDGRGASVSHEAEPGEIQIFYSRVGQTADSIIERLASKYAERFPSRRRHGRLPRAGNCERERRRERFRPKACANFSGKGALVRRSQAAPSRAGRTRASASRRARCRHVARTRESTQ